MLDLEGGTVYAHPEDTLIYRATAAQSARLWAPGNKYEEQSAQKRSHICGEVGEYFLRACAQN